MLVQKLRGAGPATLGLAFGLLTIAPGAPRAADPKPLAAEGAKVEKLAGGFTFTEGPAADAKGNVYFSDIPNNRIHRWGTTGEVSIFRENSGGANGNRFDSKGNLLSCEGNNGRVTSSDMKGNVTVVADKYEGKPFNSPNDLWIDPKGGIYFTDPRYGDESKLPQDGQHVYYVSPDRKSIKRVASDLKKPNGIIGARDGKTLYVADHGGNATFVYSIQPDGSLAGKKQIAPQGSDGMKLDERGNLYLTSAGITVYDPSGKKLQEIATPEAPANLTFGGADGKLLFITARTSIYGLKMNVKGD